jgi:adenosylcobinamide-GDP ribazoletransferase
MFSYLPIIGIVVGAIAGYAAYGLALLGLTPLAIACAFALPIVLTGALHIDGFLDSCDALFACVAPERRLQIMKDPTHGTFAIAYLAVLVVVWIAVLGMLPARMFPAVLAFAGGTARFSSVLNAEDFSRVALVVNGVLLLALSFAVGRWAWIALPVVALAVLAAGRWASKRLDGKLTGDVYGALIAVGDVATLAVCAVLYTR